MKLKGMNKWLEHMLMQARATQSNHEVCPICEAMWDERMHRNYDVSACDLCPMSMVNNDEAEACDVYGAKLLAAWEDFFVESRWAFHFYPCKCGECESCKQDIEMLKMYEAAIADLKEKQANGS